MEQNQRQFQGDLRESEALLKQILGLLDEKRKILFPGVKIIVQAHYVRRSLTKLIKVLSKQ